MAETSWDVDTMVHITAKIGIDLTMGVGCDGREKKNITLARLGSTLIFVNSNEDSDSLCGLLVMGAIGG